MNIRKFLNKPYPLNLNRWSIIIIISLFISVFLMLFQPFGLQNFKSEEKAVILAGYGVVTFLLLILNLIVLPSIFPKFLNEDRWSVYKQILWLGWIVTTISAGNYEYSVWFSIVAWVGIKGFTIFLVFTLLISIIPITGITIISYNRLLKKNLAISREMNNRISDVTSDRKRDDREIIFTSENRSQEVMTSLSNLVYIESEGNYVNIRHLKEGKPVQSLVRNTLKNIEQQIEGSGPLLKCHRAFIVNLSHVEKVIGNSQGYHLRVNHSNNEIPVARSYSKAFKNGMSMLK